MYVIRVDREQRGREPVAFWLKSTFPARWGPREQAKQFQTKGEARRATVAVKAAGWIVEAA